MKTVKYPLNFYSGNCVGFEEFISADYARKETLEVDENSLVLELPRSKFYESKLC